MEEVIRIPKQRIAILIGKNGETKKAIYSKTKVSIEIDSKTGEVTVEGEGENFLKTIDIIKAIARGFSPKRAFTLLDDNYLLKIIEISEYTGKNRSAQEAKKGRVIGKDGLIRKQIEQKTNSLISVQGKTIAIISLLENIEQTMEVIEMLLSGATHDTMEHFLEKKHDRFEL